MNSVHNIQESRLIRIDLKKKGILIRQDNLFSFDSNILFLKLSPVDYCDKEQNRFGDIV